MNSSEGHTGHTSPFDARAATWDEDPFKLNLSNRIADAVIKYMVPQMHMNVLDYGCGTGLVTLRLQPLVKSITGLDSSENMLNILQTKIAKQGIKNVHTMHFDLEQYEKTIHSRFHFIISSMTLHHIMEPSRLLKQFFDLLLPGGVLGIADLDKEDGSFHRDKSSVVHHGFERPYLRTLFEDTGFVNIHDVIATTVTREEHGRPFSVFLIYGGKKA